jgi:hypothetical protein
MRGRFVKTGASSLSLMTRTHGVGTHGSEMSVLRPIHLMSAFACASQAEMGSWRSCMQGV